MWQYAQDLHKFKSEKTPARSGGSGLNNLSLIKKVFAVGGFWGEGISFPQCCIYISNTLQCESRAQK